MLILKPSHERTKVSGLERNSLFCSILDLNAFTRNDDDDDDVDTYSAVIKE